MIYTYTKLIQGDKFSLAFHKSKVKGIVRSGKNIEELPYHREQVEHFEDEIARYSLQRSVCGDETVVM
jgi:hypothetical protein